RLPGIDADDEIVEALSAATVALGIASLRAPLLALRVARAHAALAGRTVVSRADAVVAGRLVLAPRATVLPAADDSTDGAGEEDEEPADTTMARPDGADEQAGEDTADKPLGDVVAEAAAAAIPPDLLAQLRLPDGGRVRSLRAGGAGVSRQCALRGRPIGARRGDPRAGARLNVIETLRAAAPWQRIRRRDGGAELAPDPVRPRVEIRRDDFRITRFKQRTETTTIFVVDASGSSALHRLAEAKGAVELLLADCYVRRDRVALIAFRGRGAEILLPPTRSLVRAKRSLASLPGGGGTPLAAGIDAAATLAQSLLRAGQTPIVVLLTDGRANIARDGEPGRARAEADALAATRTLRAAAITTLLIDTSPRPQAAAERLAAGMGARYLPLPYADAAAMSALIRTAADAPGSRT
ncbi:MAG: VWA domain-containing protein, partial [Xanthobacteraceae bacterium]